MGRGRTRIISGRLTTGGDVAAFACWHVSSRGVRGDVDADIAGVLLCVY